MNLADNDFQLFELPEQQRLDREQIDARWRQLQAATHPDKYVSEGAAAQRLAMQWTLRINEAYRRLKDPLTRAAYLCELRGVTIDAERNTAMPADFLLQQMQWREALDEAHSAEDVDALELQVQAQEASLFERLTRRLDIERDTTGAAADVRALMFVRRFRSDIGRRQEALEAR